MAIHRQVWTGQLLAALLWAPFPCCPAAPWLAIGCLRFAGPPWRISAPPHAAFAPSRHAAKTTVYRLHTSADGSDTPLRLHMQGNDLFSGSHFDEYVVDYSEFTPGRPDPAVLHRPPLCKGVKPTTALAGGHTAAALRMASIVPSVDYRGMHAEVRPGPPLPSPPHLDRVSAPLPNATILAALLFWPALFKACRLAHPLTRCRASPAEHTLGRSELLCPSIPCLPFSPLPSYHPTSVSPPNLHPPTHSHPPPLFSRARSTTPSCPATALGGSTPRWPSTAHVPRCLKPTPSSSGRTTRDATSPLGWP